MAEICFTLLNGRLLLFRRFGIGSVEHHEATAIYEQELMDVMQSVTRKILGNQKFKMKQEKLSPNLIRSFVNQDKQINAMDGYRTITTSIIRTPGYLLRYKAFQKYLEDYPLT